MSEPKQDQSSTTYGGVTYGFVNPEEQQAKLPTYDDATKDQPIRVDEECPDFSTDYTGMKITDCDLALKHGFIAKVYAILSFQLVITFGIVAVFSFVTPVRNYVSITENTDSNAPLIIYITSLVLFIVVYIFIICCKGARRKVPYNYMFIALFSAVTGCMLGSLASMFDTTAVAQAMCCLAGICFLMTLFGCQTRIPLGAIFIAIFTLSITAFSFAIMSIFTYNYLWPTVYATIAVAIFSLILLVDTWLITNSNHHEILMEEYVFCSLILYVDIIYIFMYLLMILGGSARN